MCLKSPDGCHYYFEFEMQDMRYEPAKKTDTQIYEPNFWLGKMATAMSISQDNILVNNVLDDCHPDKSPEEGK
jgi:hypothetical protein